MKTVISISDEVYEGAECLAHHAPDEGTEAMNRAVAEVDEANDPFVAKAASRILERSEW
jgi:hypothetical protein